MQRILCLIFPQWSKQRSALVQSGLLDADAIHVRGLSRFARAGFGKADCPDNVTDREALAQLAQWCRQFSPTVGMAESPAAACLFLDLTGIAHLVGGEPALGRTLLRRLARYGLTAQAAIADTLGAAWGVGKYSFSSTALASGAKRHCRLPALLIAAPGQTAAALRPLPVESLRLPEETVTLLHSLGIFRIAQLEALPREELSARFGPQLLLRYDQALGHVAESFPGQPLWPDFLAEKMLEYPLTRQEMIEQVLQFLLAKVCEMLVTHGRGAMRLECRLTCQDHSPVVLSVGLFRACAAVRRLLLLLQMQLERLALSAAVTAIRVEAAATAPLTNRQQELFPEVPSCRDPRHLEELLERLSSRLGRQAVVRSRLTPEAQPELAYVYQPWVDESPRRRSPRRAAVAGELPPRPLRLFRRPIPLDAVAIAPDGPPVRVRWGGSSQAVAHSWGPERIETGWWRNRPVARDYYRIETASGQRFWIFRRLYQSRWFLHGEF